MLRRTISIAVVVIGLVVVALAIASATVWRDSETVTAALPSSPGTPLVTTDPGVLELVAQEVGIRATSPDGSPVVLAIGDERDVTGWVGDAAHTRVTGLESWETLAAEQVDGAGEVPSPAGSDMWVAEATGEGEAELSWTQAPGRWTLLAATDGKAAAPVVELTWQREVSTPLLVPGVVVGVLLVLVGAALGYFAFRSADAPDVAALRERLAGPPSRRSRDQGAGPGSAGSTTADGPEGRGHEAPGTTTEEKR